MIETKIARKTEKQYRLLEYDRAMLRSGFVSLFWSVVSYRKKRGKYTLQMLADKLGTNKSGVSRWFSRTPPNWRIDTISDIANALDLDIYIRAIDRNTGVLFGSAGPIEPYVSISTQRPKSIEKLSPTPDIDTEQITFGVISRSRNHGVTESIRLSVGSQ